MINSIILKTLFHLRVDLALMVNQERLDLKVHKELEVYQVLLAQED